MSTPSEAKPQNQTTLSLDAVSRAVSGLVGGDGQGDGVCPVCEKPKFRYRVGDDGLIIFKCHSGKCGPRDGDAHWLNEATSALAAAGVPRTALQWRGHQSSSVIGPRADAAPPTPNLPTPAALRSAHAHLMSQPMLLRSLRRATGLTREDVSFAGIGWDEKERRYWLPVEDEDGNCLTVIRRRFSRSEGDTSPKSMIWPKSTGPFLYAPFGVRRDRSVVITAGERDCLALCALGFNAVCFTNGEAAVPVEDRMRPLLGTDVVLIYDNDAGNHSKTVASRLLPQVNSAKVVNWPDEIPTGYDVSDLLNDEAFGVKSVRQLLSAATPWTTREAEASVDEAEVVKALQRALVNEEVRERLAVRRADALFRVPTSDLTLAEMIAKERTPLRYTIADLHPEGSNALIAAQYKVGKTTLVVNLAKSYADGDKFLGHFAMSPGGGRIALFNYELTEDMLLDEYLIPLGIENPDRVVVLNLRGLNFDLRSRAAFTFGVKWLRERGCDALIVDPFGAAARLTNENDNSEARNWLLGTLDPFKDAAGIQDLWMPAHTGRGEKEEGAEHARGASSVDDWADVRWLYSRAKMPDAEGETTWRRFLSANGRGVGVSEREIRFDKEDRSLFVGDFMSRAQARATAGHADVLRIVNARPMINATDLKDGLAVGSRDKARIIESALRSGVIKVIDGAGVQGSRSGWKHYVTPDYDGPLVYVKPEV